MSGSKLVGAFVVAALFLGLNAPSADAAMFARRSAAGFRAGPGPGVKGGFHRSSTAGFRAGPGPGVGGGFRRSSTTAVRATPFRPVAGPQVYHRSRTAFVR